jgi:DNA transformation protein
MPRPPDEFVAHVLELLAPLGPVRARGMFGGYGVYCDDVIFALIVDDALYLRTDEANRPAFVAAGLEPFVYLRKGEPRSVVSYYQAPPESMDDSAAMAPWARDALAVALRARATKSAATKRPRAASASAGRRRRPR